MNFTMMLGAVALIPKEITDWLQPLLQILMALVGIGVVTAILMQKGTNNNIGVIGGQESDNYAGKNKAKSRQGLLRRLTVIGLFSMLVLSIVYFLTFLQK